MHSEAFETSTKIPLQTHSHTLRPSFQPHLNQMALSIRTFYNDQNTLDKAWLKSTTHDANVNPLSKWHTCLSYIQIKAQSIVWNVVQRILTVLCKRWSTNHQIQCVNWAHRVRSQKPRLSGALVRAWFVDAAALFFLQASVGFPANGSKDVFAFRRCWHIWLYTIPPTLDHDIVLLVRQARLNTLKCTFTACIHHTSINTRVITIIDKNS